MTNITTRIQTSGFEELRDVGVPNQDVCVNCHTECFNTCLQPAEIKAAPTECLPTGQIRCKNYEWVNDDDIPECVATCPDGTFVSETDIAGRTKKTCKKCDSGCARCEGDMTTHFKTICDYNAATESAQLAACQATRIYTLKYQDIMNATECGDRCAERLDPVPKCLECNQGQGKMLDLP